MSRPSEWDGEMPQVAAELAPRPRGTDVDADRLDADAGVQLARQLLTISLADESMHERRRRERLGRLLADEQGRELILSLTDEVLRLDTPPVAARRFSELVAAHRTSALGVIDRVMLRAGALVAPVLPRLVMPLVVRRVKSETRGIVLPSEDPQFARHLRGRAGDGVRLNINPLGEAILSDAEADARLAVVMEKIGRTDVDYVSVKISSIVANLDALAFEHTVERVAERLRVVYRAGLRATPTTFVNLDMEEYRDLDLTIEAFTQVLSEPEFAGLDAGIVLQAYLPDSHDAAERLGAWAIERRGDGGGRIKVRLVKGANLAMEEVEAELHGWIAAPYGSKAEVDASYKRLLDSLLRLEWADAVLVGVASHNLFDVAWAMVRTRALGAAGRVQFEMLEGMAPAQARAVQDLTANEGFGQLLLYSPVVADEDFDASIAYLSRRLDENTQADNFLRSLFTLTVDSHEFRRQAAMFRAAVEHRHDVPAERRRRAAPRPREWFSNEPESDFTDPDLRGRVEEALAAVELVTPRSIETTDEIDTIMARAVRAADPGPAGVDWDQRRRWLLDTATAMRDGWIETMAIMAAETGKTMHQADPEVAEAIDFCNYYGLVGSRHLEHLVDDDYTVRPRGVVAVVAPWNFPFAIPTGGVAAALAAGNSVILKPAPEAVHVGARIAELFWAAGVPRDVLQLVVCDDGPVGTRLVTHPDLDTITLTGAFETAEMFLQWRPDVRVLAETSGKNSLIITAAADLDEAIADLVDSAFGHAGQKCSAASLAIVEASVYDDPSFLTRLRDAVTSLRVEPASDLSSMVGPVIAVPSGSLERALTTLEPGESWLVEPQQIGVGDLAGRLWTPGVRIGVQPTSWFHRTECFGPVLGVMRARHLGQAIHWQNGTDYGLTGGLHSLDPTQIDTWLERVEVGNAYVNRAITGAIVQRQPFGGWKRSSVGGGAKAGGPGYVQQFARISESAIGDVLVRARASYPAVWDTYFLAEHDPSGLDAESNVLRYVSLDRVIVRHDGTDALGLQLLRLAAQTTGVRLEESLTTDESDAEFAHRLDDDQRVRLLTGISDETRLTCHRLNIPIDDSVPVSDGFVELHRWVKEQSISRTMHRHGRLTPRP